MEDYPNPTIRVCRVDEAAKMLGISRNTAYQAVRNGEIPSFRVGHLIRVPLDALERLIACGGGGEK